MKKLKQYDFWISTMLITAFFFTGIISYVQHNAGAFFMGYSVVGGWQIFSMIIHGYNHWFTYNKDKRYIYHWITFIAIITIPLGSFAILLFTAPFMAIYYTWICYNEVYVKMQRPLSFLK